MSGPDLSRRQFLQAVAASGVTAVLFAGCAIPPHELQEQSPVVQPEDLAAASEDWYATVCRLCPAGCGMLARVVDGRVRKVEGNPEHPVNRGKLCARGQAAVQQEYHPDRIRGPMLRAGPRGSGQWTPIDWNDAFDRLHAALAHGRPGSTTLVTEPARGHLGLLVDRFARATGTNWLVETPLGEAALRRAIQDVFGQGQLPLFDIGNAQTVLAFGADFLDTWVSPVYYGRAFGILRQGEYSAGTAFAPRTQRPRGKVIYAGPRFSATAASADDWLYVKPGQEGALAMSLAQCILSESLADPSGAAAFGNVTALNDFDPDIVAPRLGLDASRIRQVAREFASNRPSVALGGGAAGAQTNATESLSAVLALNVLVGSVGQPGGVIPTHEAPFDGFPRSNPSTLADWQDLVEGLRSGAVQTLLVHRANPVHNLPDSLGFADALRGAGSVLSFSSFLDDTTALADVVLPTHLPLEEWGDDVPEMDGGLVTVTMQQPVVQPLYDTRAFGDLLLTAAAELGGAAQQALPWSTMKDLLREAANQLAQVQAGSPSPTMDLDQFWTSLLQHGVWTSASGTPVPFTLGRAPASIPDPRFSGDIQSFPYILLPFVHNTLGEGSGAELPWLQAAPDPITSAVWQTWVELNPQLAHQLGVSEGDVVRLESPAGAAEVPVYVNPAASPDVLAVPLGQGHSSGGRWASRRGINPLVLVSPAVDNTSGGLAYAATRVRLTRTGRTIPLPKLEGDVPAYQLPGKEVLKVTNA